MKIDISQITQLIQTGWKTASHAVRSRPLTSTCIAVAAVAFCYFFTRSRSTPLKETKPVKLEENKVDNKEKKEEIEIEIKKKENSVGQSGQIKENITENKLKEDDKKVVDTIVNTVKKQVLPENIPQNYCWKILRDTSLIQAFASWFIKYCETHKYQSHESVKPLMESCKKGLELCEAKDFNLERSGQVRDAKKNILQCLRDLTCHSVIQKYSVNSQKHTISAHVFYAFNAFYTGVNINICVANIFDVFVKAGLIKNVNMPENTHKNESHVFIKDCRPSLQMINLAPREMKAPGMGQRYFDPNMGTNYVSQTFAKQITTKEGEYTCSNIVMGAPVSSHWVNSIFYSTGGYQPTVAPEFEKHLLAYQTLGSSAKVKQKHLYFDLQDPSSTPEKPRCDILDQLASCNFKNVFYVVRLDARSFFYEQEEYQLGDDLNVVSVNKKIINELFSNQGMGAVLTETQKKDPQLKNWAESQLKLNQVTFDNLKQRTTYIETFHIALRYKVKDIQCSSYDPKELFYQQLKKSCSISTNAKINLDKWMNELIKGIHENLFDKKTHLSVQEKRIFIRLFHQFLIEKLTLEIEPTAYNISDSEGTGISSALNGENFALHAILNKKTEEKEFINFFNIHLHTRDIIVHKKGIEEKTLNRTMETVAFMLENQGKVVKLYGELFPEVKVTLELEKAK